MVGVWGRKGRRFVSRNPFRLPKKEFENLTPDDKFWSLKARVSVRKMQNRQI
ncbi:hypothetical protein CAMSH0001_0226 [Campylobacter showae RM3277]|uniref:Uncharacterized protein n=1 Tax=Campylobacter showae RM3277 TaxID=553219 RepID=C6RI74_9BACT|nr:hypothetical protein CAMSH0001_0226 [Campylobacter showae RM3277]